MADEQSLVRVSMTSASWPRTARQENATKLPAASLASFAAAGYLDVVLDLNGGRASMMAIFRNLSCWLMPAVLVCSAGVFAQDKPPGYPVRPIRILIGAQPGAGGDTIARATAKILSDRWGQNVVVDSRSGGGGVIASGILAKSTPDGYTLLQSGDGLLLQSATQRVPFNVLDVFDPVVNLTQQPYILMVNMSVPARSVKELIALSASKPLSFAGSTGVGGTVHLGMVKLEKLSGMQLKHVTYKGSAPALLALMGGEVSVGVSASLSATNVIRSGKARGVASLGLTRTSSLPELPTIGEQGFPGFQLTNRYNLWAPAGTPRPIILAINRVAMEGMNTPQMVQRLEADGGEPAERMSPEQLKAELTRKYAELVRQVKELGLKF
jgi:tripartite-type tricarboxylate transporter receptor subunit TctC